MSELWHNVIALAPDGEVLDTKLDDEHGERHHALLKRQGRLWFFPDNSMYVYYTPTHWRRPTAEQLEQLARADEAKAKEHLKRAAAMRAAILPSEREI